MFKRILACLLVLVTLVSYLPPRASATETQPQIKNDVTVEGTNSFGTLLANTVQNDSQSQSEGENSRICDLQIEGTLATVEYTTDRAAKVVVAIYTEDGATMLGSGVTEVVPEDTQTVVEIQIASMPRYYSAAAYLLDAETNDPLSPVFRTQLYTKVVQDLKNSTVEDYDPERVLNLDDDNTTNFAVFGENTILVQEGSHCQISGGNGVYTVTNADERFLSMKAGDSFAAPQSDGSTLIVKAAKVSVQGNTVTIYEDTNADLSDVFEVIKIEATADKKDTTYDDSTLDPDFKSISAEEFRARQGKVAPYYILDREDEDSFEREFETDGENLQGSLKLKGTFELKVYIVKTHANKYAYVSQTLSMSLTGSLKVTAKIVDYEADFVGVEMTLFRILVVTYTPKFYFKASVSMEYSVELKVTMGEIYDSDVGAWQNVSSSPTLESALEFSGELYIGIGGELGFSLFLNGFLTIAVELQMGAELTAKIKLDNPFSQPGSTIHSCNVCIDGELNGVVKVDLKSIILFNEKNLLGNTWKTKISDFFYCVDENEFGFTKCPHKVFRIKLTVRDSGGAPLEGASVWLYDREGNPVQVTLADKDGTYIADDIPNTDEKGQTVFYLPNGEYQLEAVKDDQRRAMDITVHEEAKELSIVLTVQSGETAIRMVPEQLTLDVNAQEQLKVLFGNYRQALDVTNACVWSCGNPKVATVEKGKVTAVGPGTAAVVASYTKDGERYFVRCNVTVKGTDAASGKCGDNLYWSLTEDGTLTIWGSGEMYNYNVYPFKGPWGADEITIPIRSVVIKSGATSIGDYAFSVCSGLTSVTIPESVTSIGNGSFSGCEALTNVTIPKGVTNIGAYAFSGCKALTSMTIPEGVTNIGWDAFEGCSSLTSVIIPSSVESINVFTFSGCTSLTNVTIPSSVKNIGDSAFSSCTSLKNVTIPSSVKGIDNNAFSGCTGLIGITISEGVASIGNNAFWGCRSLTSVTIPSSMVNVGTGVFWNCSGLTSVTIPSSVISIDYGAFYGCTSLKDVYYAGNQAQWDEIRIADKNEPLLNAILYLNCGSLAGSGKCGDNLYWKITEDNTLEIYGYGEMEEYGATGAPWSDYHPEKLILKNGITRISAGAFEKCTELKGELVIPESVKYIGASAFAGCSGFSGDLVIPSGVEVIEYSTFYNCSGFNGRLILPEGLREIGNSAFSFCKGFTGNLQLPNSLVKIGSSAFFDCMNFTGNLIIPEGITNIESSSFNGCRKLSGIKLPSKLKEIEDYAFNRCWGMTGNLLLPEGITNIGDSAFSGCSFTGNLTLPDSLISIGSYAFNACSFTGNLVIPADVIAIGESAFNGCRGLTGTLVIPAGVTVIAEEAFWDCGFSRVELSEGTTRLQRWAFGGCSNLSDICIPASVQYIEWGVFNSTPLRDVWYGGTTARWNRVEIDTTNRSNASLVAATIHCSNGTIEGANTFAAQPDETTDTVPTEGTVPGGTAETAPEPAAEPTQPQETEETAQPLSTITWFRVPKGAKMEDGAAVRLSAHTGKETVRNGVRSVAFVGLEPGEEYVLIVSLKPGSVQPEDLQYIEQSAADGNGSVSFTYIPRTEVSAITQLYGISAQRKITLDREYLTIPMGSLSEPIQATVDPEEWTDDLVWFSENEDVVTVDENGCVTPVSVGTGYVVAEVTHGKYTITARCRVDVTEKVANEEVLGVDLGTKKVTTELYSTDYAKIDILPRLKQNEIALFSFFSAMPADNGSTITGAYLEDENARQFFELRVKDDRQLLLVPTQEALDNAKGVKSSYSSKIVVLVNGVEYHTDDAVTISVKKTMPKLKAANLTFNPFYTEESQTLTITGGTVTKVEGTTPDWLTMDGTKLTLSNAPKSGSASLNLLVYTTEWAIPVNVKASVKLSYKAPRLKLSASSVTLSETDSLGVTLKLTAGKQSLEELNVKSVTLPAGFEDTELNLYTGEIALVPIGEIPTGKQAVRVSFYGTDSVLDLPLRVNKRTPTLRLSKTSVSLNAELGDSMTLKVTATPADLDLAKVTVTNPSEALEVSPVNENGEFTVTVKQGSASKASYALMVQAPTGKAAKLTVKTLAAGQKVTMSLKAAGSIDLTFPEKGVALQPKYRNYAGELENVVYTLALKQGKVTLDAAFDDYLTIGEDGLIRWNGTGSLESGNVCLITMTGELPNGTMLFATAQVRVTQTPVILRLSKASLSLNKRLEEKTQVTVTTSTRGYTLGDVELLVTDNKNAPSDGLTAAYENGLLTLSVNEKTVYGGSYKVQLWVTPKRVTTLMVRIPAEKNSAVTMTARARGGIDVIRDASEVIVTPVYRNCLDGASLKKQVKVTWAQDGRNYSQDVTEDFILTWAQDGTLHVSKVPGKELALTGKYRLEILCEGMEKEAYTALSVKCGTARFTVASVSLYAKDANDMARLTITTTDKTVNTLERVELKDARLKGTYEVLDLGGGQFALCLIPGAKAKTGTVTLNLFCEGNTTAKPSGTVSVKVEIR